MDTINKYEYYPVKSIIITSLFSLVTNALGFIILLNAGIVFALLFLSYILFLEFRLIKYRCTECYYWGKSCAFGKGRISALFFKKGHQDNFCKGAVTLKSLIPDMMVFLIPFFTAIFLLIISFNWLVLLELIVLIFLSSAGNGIIRGKFACNHCLQKDIGCPAVDYFNNRRKKIQ